MFHTFLLTENAVPIRPVTGQDGSLTGILPLSETEGSLRFTISFMFLSFRRKSCGFR